MRQAENRVKVEGILAEIDIKPGQFKKKDGQMMDSIGGHILVKVVQKISGEEKELAIPVHMFAAKLTNKGTPNPAYESIKKIADEYVSIAASENGEDGADRVRITSGDIRMNEYYSADGRLISFPRVNASFVTRIGKNDCKPEATYTAEFVVANKSEEMRNDEPTGRYKIDAIVPQYGGKVDVIPMYAQSAGVIDAVSTYWEVGDTVRANGRLDFSATTETTIEEVDFGEPIERTRTINRSDLIITGGSQEPLEGDFAFDNGEIQNALADRKNRLEAQKDRDMSRAASKQTPAQNSKNGFADLGF